MRFLSCRQWLTRDLIVRNVTALKLVRRSFLLRGRLKFIRGHLAGEIFIRVLRNLSNILLHLSSLAEHRTADLIANIQTEIGPHRYEKSNWHERLSISPSKLFLLSWQFQFHGCVYFVIHFWIKKNISTHPCSFPYLKNWSLYLHSDVFIVSQM